MPDLSMFALSWIYLYGVGGVIYVLGTMACVRTGVLDWKNHDERRMYLATTACLVLFAAIHALFQFVLPFVGPSR